MRPYRGLTKEGKWVYGGHCKVAVQDYIIPDDAITRVFPWRAPDTCCHVGIQGTIVVIPETVGQSIGKKDKYGIDIYEGDRVNFWLYMCEHADVGTIKWQRERHRFAFINQLGKNTEWGFTDKDIMEVTGNIHQEKKA